MTAITDLQSIYMMLKELLHPFSPPLTITKDEEARFDLVSIKKVEIEGRKRSEVYFASIIQRKDYVGFYFMPVYSAPEMKAFFQPELLGRLKGKSCFHIKSLDEKLLGQIRQACEKGFHLYQNRGWV
jgi:hypothetical protein